MKEETKKLTRSGYEALERELRHLIDVESVDVKNQLSIEKIVSQWEKVI